MTDPDGDMIRKQIAGLEARLEQMSSLDPNREGFQGALEFMQSYERRRERTFTASRDWVRDTSPTIPWRTA